MEKRLQISSEDDDKETNLAKRMKPGSVTGKSVVVLRHSDVTIGQTSVLMPNTIEMAQLKKPVKGQFKRNVEISSEMSELDVKRALIDNFPILKHERFCCAAASDNRTRLEFHGNPRVWDGRSIRRKIKGNSALYILIEKEHHQQSECSPMKSDLPLLGLDEYIETEELSAKSVSDSKQVEMHTRHSVHHAPQTGLEKQTVPGNPLKELTRYSLEESGLAQRTEEKNSDNLQPTEGQVMRHEPMDQFPPSQGFVLVASQRGIFQSAHHGSISTVQSMTNARDVPTMATSFLSQSLPVGAIVVPGGGIAVAQPRVIANNAVSSASMVGHPGVIGGKAISTTSDHQSLGKTVFHVAEGQGARHAGLPIVPPMNMIVPQRLTPQLNSLNISSATTQQFQKQGAIATEKSTGMRDQDTQTETTETFQQVASSRTMLQQDGKNYPVEFLKTTLALEGARFKSPDQPRQSHKEKTNTSWFIRKGADLNIADEGRHPHISRVSSDYESQVSDQTDSGIEMTDNIGGNRLPLLCDAIEIMSAFTEKKSIITEIFPKESSIRGGDMFVLILNEALASDTDEGYYAKFGFSPPVVLTKVNQVNLKGTIPAYHSPGVVTVQVVSSTRSHLGQTLFEYIDAVDDILKKLEHDEELHRRFFHFMAQELRNATRKPENRQPSPAISGFKTPGIPEDMKKKVYEGSEYEADDEGSDDGELPCTKVAGWNPISKLSSHDDVNERTGHREDIEEPCGPPAGESVDGRFRNITERQNSVFQVNLYIFADLGNLTPFSFTAQESGARISEVEPSATPSKSSDEVAGTAFDNNGTARSNSDSPETANNPENMDTVDNHLNNDVDQNSVAEETWYADKGSGDEDDDSPGNPL